MWDVGDIVCGFFGVDLMVWDKFDDVGLVIEVDLVVDIYFKLVFFNVWFDYGWLLEEIEDIDYCFVIECQFILDFIDGICVFINGNEDWGVLVVVVERGEIIVVVVYMLVKDMMFVVVKGQGVILNGMLMVVQVFVFFVKVLIYKVMFDYYNWKDGQMLNIEWYFWLLLVY